MTERAIADFVGRYVVDPASGTGEDPRDCRVVMSRRRIVVASDGDRLTVPLSAIVDVVVGNVPPDLRELFDDTVTVAYETEDEGNRTVLVEASSETMTRFVDVLFKCLLNGAEAVVKHPAKVGGRVTNTEATPAELSVDAKRVQVATPAEDFEIEIDAVVDFDRVRRAPDGDDRPTLVVVHADGSAVVTTLVAPDSGRTMNLLGRYLRIEYGQLRRETEAIELDESEKRALVAVYAAGGDVDFTRILDGDAARATNVLNSLGEKGLVDEDETGIVPTSRGRIIVNRRLGAFDV